MAAAIKQRLDSAESVLIVPKQEPDLDVLAASFSLARALHKAGKKTSMYIDPDIYTEVLKAKFPPQSISFMKKDEPGSIVISLNNIDAPVSEVKWKEEKGTVNIYVTTDGGNVPGDKVKINRSSTLADLAVLVDASSPEDLGDYYTSHRQQFFADTVTIFTPNGVNSPEAITGYEIRTPSFSQGMFEFMQREDMHVDDGIATTLLAGLYWRTENFKNDLNEDSFTRAAELQNAGANQELARNIANRTLSLHDARYFADIYSSVITAGDGIFYTIVPERKAKEKELFTDHVPVASLIGCRAAFTVVHGSGSNVVYLKSNTRDISLEQIVEKYKGKLNGSRAIITSDAPSEALAQDIAQMLKQAQPPKRTVEPEANIPAPGRKEQKSNPDKDYEKTKKWLDEMSKEAKQTQRPQQTAPAPQQNQRRTEPSEAAGTKRPEPQRSETAESKPEKKHTTEKPATEPSPKQQKSSQPATPSVPDFNFSPATPDMGNQGGGDPLTPATEAPEPLDLEGKKNKPQQDQSFAPNTPLPPASI